MKTRRLDMGDPEEVAEGGPDCGGELSAAVGGDFGWNSETGNPTRQENTCTVFGGDGGQRKSLRPSRGFVDHC